MSYVILSVDELPKPVIPLKPIVSDDSDKGDKSNDNQDENVVKEEYSSDEQSSIPIADEVGAATRMRGAPAKTFHVDERPPECGNAATCRSECENTFVSWTS